MKNGLRASLTNASQIPLGSTVKKGRKNLRAEDIVDVQEVIFGTNAQQLQHLKGNRLCLRPDYPSKQDDSGIKARVPPTTASSRCIIYFR